MFEFTLIWFVSFWICGFVTLLRDNLPQREWLPAHEHPVAATIIPVANFVYAIYNVVALVTYLYDFTKEQNEFV